MVLYISVSCLFGHYPVELNHSRQSTLNNLTVRHTEGNSVSAAIAEINLLSSLKYKRVNRTCCDTCTHRV
jgi:hypothetical protein